VRRDRHSANNKKKHIFVQGDGSTTDDYNLSAFSLNSSNSSSKQADEEEL